MSEIQEQGPLQLEDRLTVKGIADIDDLYGVIVEIRYNRKKHHFPLCDLEATDQKSSNYEFVHDYVVWFANR